jgi:hypothetical protein
VIIGRSELARRGLDRYLRCGCYDADVELVIVVCGNSVNQFKFVCQGCGAKSGPVSHRSLPEPWRELATIIQINERIPTPPCERCGSDDDTQYHHMAPRELFPDAEEWPGVYLCQPCHTRYHQIMTPADLYRVVKQKRGDGEL